MSGIADDTCWFHPMCEHGLCKLHDKCEFCAQKRKKMLVTVYLHGDKEGMYEEGERLGLSGQALDNFRGLAYEVKLEYEVDPKTGQGTLLTVDGKKLV